MCFLCVAEVGCLCERYRALAQSIVKLENLGAIDELGIAIDGCRALRDVACGEVAWLLTSIDLVLKSDLYGELGKGYRSEGPNFGTDTGYTREKKVGLGKVEFRRQDESKSTRGSVDLAFSGDEVADGAIEGAVRLGEERREARDGDVLLQEIELGQSVPASSFGGELQSQRQLSGLGRSRVEICTHHADDEDFWGESRLGIHSERADGDG